jgi:hypothetical protein
LDGLEERGIRRQIVLLRFLRKLCYYLFFALFAANLIFVCWILFRGVGVLGIGIAIVCLAISYIAIEKKKFESLGCLFRFGATILLIAFFARGNWKYSIVLLISLMFSVLPYSIAKRLETQIGSLNESITKGQS